MTTIEFPKSACAYEVYDPKTLKPLNRQTCVRMAELGWTREDFAGKTVLDIGANTGLLSIYAHQLGAAGITALDVQINLVEFFSLVVQQNDLPIKVERRGFKELDIGRDASDVVLFMEVLHWTTSQGIPIKEALKTLTMLARDTLYMEFPWSVKEPSIRAQTHLTEETYSADIVLEELGRFYEDVRVIRFMKYFGYKSESRRVLIRARGKRPEAAVLMQLSNTDPLHCDMTRGRNTVTVCHSENGPLVIKSLSGDSFLCHGDGDTIDALFQKMAPFRVTGTCVMPIQVGSHYSVRNEDGATFMVFPLIEGDEPMRQTHKKVSPQMLIEIASNINEQFSVVSEDVAFSLRQAGGGKRAINLVRRAAKASQKRDLVSKEVWDAALALVVRNQDIKEEDLDGLSHGDLQTGNIVFAANGEAKVVDLDNLVCGTIYLDGLMGLAWLGASPVDIEMLERKFTSRGLRRIEIRDVALATGILMVWLISSEPLANTSSESARILGCAKGLKTLAQIGQEIASR